MTAVHYSGSTSSADRRRRLMATEMDAEFHEPELSDLSAELLGSHSHQAFPMLSRDRLIRRVISPRLWKHVTVAVFLTLSPVIYAMVIWSWNRNLQVPDSSLLMSRLSSLRGISGLKLFAAGQLCLLIAWVRSASPVDFKGRFRWWRWLALVLFAVSVVNLTDSSAWLTDLMALCLEPAFGSIESARPALLFIPVSACIALILRHVIPDMGRCRVSQSLLVVATGLLAVRSLIAAKWNAAGTEFHLGTLELLISGIVLSAIQLHARFVIHINPNPPVAVEKRTTVQLPRLQNAVTSSGDASSDESSLPPQLEVVASIHTRTETISESKAAEPKAPVVPEAEASLREEPLVVAPEHTESVQQQPKGKSSKKQKLRKAG